MTEEDDALSQQLSTSLFERLKNYMQLFEIDDSIMHNMKQSVVSVKVIDGAIFAEVFCTLCQSDHTVKRKLKGKYFTRMAKVQSIGCYRISEVI